MRPPPQTPEGDGRGEGGESGDRQEGGREEDNQGDRQGCTEGQYWPRGGLARGTVRAVSPQWIVPVHSRSPPAGTDGRTACQCRVVGADGATRWWPMNPDAPFQPLQRWP